MRSNDELGKTFAAMFPQLKILYNFNLARTKFMYVINHGLAPLFKSMLNGSLQKFNIHVFCFDESLNEATQTYKMDMYIKYWNDNSNTVNVHYYGSSFLGHATHQDLFHNFNSLSKDLDPTHFYQTSMDSPNVNMKFFRSFRSTTKNVASIHWSTSVAVACILFMEVFHEKKQNQDGAWKNFWKVFIMFFTIHQQAEKITKVLPVPIHTH